MTAIATAPTRSAPPLPARTRSPLERFVRGLGSQRLAVALLVLLGVLTWLGTLAQVDKGLFDVQREYFESWIVRQKLPALLGGPWWSLPLPGAYPVLVLLFVNLLVGGMLRLRLSRRTVGVMITHVGIGLLLVAGFVKLHGSYSGNLALLPAPKNGEAVGERVVESASFVSFHDHELALLKDAGAVIEERTVPEAVLARAGGDDTVVLRTAGVPFTVTVSHWLPNCAARPKGPMFEAETPVLDGVFLRRVDPSMQREQDLAGCYVTVLTEAGERHEAILTANDRRPLSASRVPFTFTVAGQRWGLDLRRVIHDLPFRVRLDEFKKVDHPGTTMARDFRSFVTVSEGAGERSAQIFMNTPLRKDGFVLYQSSFGQVGAAANGEPVFYTSLEVANNPSDQWPMIACFVIGIGLLVHFVTKLWLFLDSSTRKALQS